MNVILKMSQKMAAPIALFLKQYLHVIWGTDPESQLLQECPLVSFYPVADKNPPRLGAYYPLMSERYHYPLGLAGLTSLG